MQQCSAPKSPQKPFIKSHQELLGHYNSLIRSRTKAFPNHPYLSQDGCSAHHPALTASNSIALPNLLTSLISPTVTQLLLCYSSYPAALNLMYNIVSQGSIHFLDCYENIFNIYLLSNHYILLLPSQSRN